MKIIALYFLCLAVAAKESLAMSRTFTPLELNNHPCSPEKLRATNRYLCDSNGTVICQNGWEPCNDAEKEKLEPCLMPVCDPQCQHGECRSPDLCACEIGWEGTHCDTCVPLPGCVHGTCENAMECNCEDGWEGGYCDIRKYLNSKCNWCPWTIGHTKSISSFSYMQEL